MCMHVVSVDNNDKGDCVCGRKHRLYEDLYRCQYNLAGIYQRTGNLSQALRHVDVSIKCATKVKDKLAERESLILKGKVRTITSTTATTAVTFTKFFYSLT